MSALSVSESLQCFGHFRPLCDISLPRPCEPLYRFLYCPWGVFPTLPELCFVYYSLVISFCLAILTAPCLREFLFFSGAERITVRYPTSKLCRHLQRVDFLSTPYPLPCSPVTFYVSTFRYPVVAGQLNHVRFSKPLFSFNLLTRVINRSNFFQTLPPNIQDVRSAGSHA